MPTTERPFDADLVNMLRMQWFDRMGAMPSAATVQTVLTLLHDLRERIAVYAERKDGYLAESIRKLDLLAPEGRADG